MRVRIDSSRHSSRGDPFQSPTCCCGGGRTPRRRALWVPPWSGSSSSARAAASPPIQRLAPPRQHRLLLGQVRVAAQQVWSSFLGIPRSYSASATRSTKSLEPFGWSESFRPAGWFGLFPSRATVHLSAATVFLSHKTSRYNVLASFFQTSERGY